MFKYVVLVVMCLYLWFYFRLDKDIFFSFLFVKKIIFLKLLIFLYINLFVKFYGLNVKWIYKVFYFLNLYLDIWGGNLFV